MPELNMKHFFIDPAKSGAVLRAFIVERKLSIADVEDETGIDYDTLRNYLRGKIQKVTLDCLLKILTVTEHTLTDYFTALFATDGIHLYDAVIYEKSTVIPEISPAPSENSTTVSAPTPMPAEKFTPSAGTTVAELEHYTQHIDDLNERHVQRIAAQYEHQIAHLEAWHKDELDLLEKRHAQMVQHFESDIEKRDKEIETLRHQLHLIQSQNFGVSLGKGSDR